MLEFKTVTLEDKKWADELIFKENSRSADFNFGNIYIWDKHYKQLITQSNGRMFTKLRYNGESEFVYPVGNGDLRTAIEQIREFANAKGYKTVIRGITCDAKDTIERLYPHKFDFTEDVDCADYIYLAEKLSNFNGKDLHQKKNHCNRFEKEHSWYFKPITRALIPTCMDMLAVWTETNKERLDSSISYEHDAILRAFAAFEKLKLEGGVLFADDKVVGFSIGEMTNEDCFNVHFEKADINLNGAYTMVCREMTRIAMSNHEKLKYINREDDMGLEGLRRSKLSYKPEYLVKKYTARWKE